MDKHGAKYNKCKIKSDDHWYKKIWGLLQNQQFDPKNIGNTTKMSLSGAHKLAFVNAILIITSIFGYVAVNGSEENPNLTSIELYLEIFMIINLISYYLVIGFEHTWNNR